MKFFSACSSRAKKTRSASPTFSSTTSSTTTTPTTILRRDRDSKFTRRELEQVLRRLGVEDEVPAILAEMDGDENGRISLENILKENDEEEKELRVAFEVYDTNGDGKISAEELRDVFKMLGDRDCGIEDCRKMIDGVDSDGDGFVCFKDFTRMMMEINF